MIFQYGGRRHLGFSKIRNFNSWSAARGQYVSSCQLSSHPVKRSQRYGDLTVFFQNGGRPPSWIWSAPIGTIRDDHLVVYRCAKFGWNRCSSFDIMKLSIFCPFGLKTPIHAIKMGFEGYFTPNPKWGAISMKPPKGISLREFDKLALICLLT